MTTHIFHFTLGPVQSFVAQARRTRDFWAGSFLLSWLVGVAMRTVIVQHGHIVFPVPNENDLNWLSGTGRGKPPRQGNIPNRFKAMVGADFEPARVEEAVRDAWRAVAEMVWREDLQRHCEKYPHTREIWDRQINGFWEIAWALGEDDALLDQRKNWRTQLPPEEAGIKCSVMAGWQELSGLPAPNAQALEAFWQPIRNDGGRDFAEDEALCAIAFVKRRFPHYFEKVEAKMPGDWTLHGWRVNPRTPSTLDLAAAHWLAHAMWDEAESALYGLHEAAARLPFSPDDCGINRLRCVREASRLQELPALNSSVLFSHVLDNAGECSDQPAARAMKKALSALQIKESPSPFYAILLMDGDKLGELLRQAGSKVSRALETFTRQVPDVVDRHNGFLIYAGGDDVLALLPLEDALQCAADLRQCYITAFATQGLHSTLSGAVEYAHVKTPLTRILGDAHHLLDDIAKTQCGRDAIAVRVWKPGGQALQWAMPWERALAGNHLKIEQLAAQFAEKHADFSSKFLYKIREHFGRLNPDSFGDKAIFSAEELLALLAVDYLASGVNEGRRDQLTLDDAQRIIGPLLEQCRPVIRKGGDTVSFTPSQRLEPDGALFVRFLAHKGVERQ